MKALILAALLIGLLAPSAQAQSQGALEACRDINPPVVWRECIEKYEARERELKQDPQYQAEQKRIKEDQRMRRMEFMQRELDRNRGVTCIRSGNITTCN